MEACKNGGGEFLFAAQSDHWIHPSSATRGQKTGQRGDKCEQAGNCKVDRRVERIDLKKNVL
jgi:hypothetical protein